MTASADNLPILCSYENRADSMVGWKLLSLSLQRHSPSLRLVLFSRYFPPCFVAWHGRRAPAVRMVQIDSDKLLNWNMKPTVFRHLFAEGYERVFWVDSDVLVTRDIRPRLQQIPDAAVAVGEENGRFDDRRVTFHGFEVGRRFARNPNTSLLLLQRRHHQPLVARWAELMEREPFQAIQGRGHAERPIYCWSEQDVFTGLLGAAGERGFAHLPVDLFALDRDVIHTASPHRLKARLRRIRGDFPPFVHAQGRKPWQLDRKREPSLADVQIELSPFLTVARDYRAELDEAAPWLFPHSGPARLLRALALGHPHYQGIPAMVLSDLLHWRNRRARAEDGF